ncbi:MAG: GrpB family protein [Chloroflexota bacterium]
MITIHDYNPSWPEEFEAIRAALAEALGPLALHIDHIGSTSVPSLGAKDIIDVQVTVEALSSEVRDRLIEAGYAIRPGIARDHVPAGSDTNPAQWTKMLFTEQEGARRANIHVRQQGHLNQQYPLLFRDYLRAHPRSAESIEIIKRQLAKRFADDVESYYDIKDPVYDLIWDAAQAWAEDTGWSPEQG